MGKKKDEKLTGLAEKAAVGLIRCYQILLSSWMPPRCRFYPSCSQYAAMAIEKYGLFRGAAKGVRRILRCHPWNEGGYDPLPED